MFEDLKTNNLSYRKADASDTKLIFEWSNDPLVRMQSFNSERILFEDHVRWLEHKLKSESNQFYIAEMGGIPVALVRIENIPDKTVIGILLDEQIRGMGLSSYILKDVTNKYFSEYSEPITALIKKDNMASVKGFEKAGFKYIEDSVINDSECFVYRLFKN